MPDNQTGWTFRYFRADRTWIETKPRQTESEALGARKSMKDAGVMCSEIYPIEGVFIPAEGIQGKIEIFEQYFGKEMSILNGHGINYDIFYQFLESTITRIRLFLSENIPTIITNDTYPEGLKNNEIQERQEYLEKVIKIIQREASQYSPADGSCPEDIKDELNKLAQDVQDGNIQKIPH